MLRTKIKTLALSHRGISTAPAKAKILVGAPDVLSNLRPAIYDGVWFTAVSSIPSDAQSAEGASLLPSTLVHPNSTTDHPYSLEEFGSSYKGKGVAKDPFHDEREAWNLQHRLQQQSLDAFSHAFWTDTNSRFNAYKQYVMNSTTSSLEYRNASPDKQEQMIEESTASFYRTWMAKEGVKQRAYTKEMHVKQYSLIWLGFRREIQKLKWKTWGNWI